MSRAALVLRLLAPCVWLSTGCYPAPQTVSTTVEPDSVTGIVSITGTSFDQHLVLRSANGVTPLSAAASESAALSRVGGIEVLVVGQQTPGAFRVQSFKVLSVDGSPVLDGVLGNDDGRIFLDTARGRIPLGNPPAPLRDMIGARVWIGGSVDTGPNSYGVIVPVR